MKITIHGPNLNDQSKGQFHVHAAECAANTREVARNGSKYPETVEVDSRLGVVEMIYADQLDESPGTKPEDWLPDFYFEPCLKGFN